MRRIWVAEPCRWPKQDLRPQRRGNLCPMRHQNARLLIGSGSLPPISRSIGIGAASRPRPPTPPGLRIRTKAVRLVRQFPSRLETAQGLSGVRARSRRWSVRPLPSARGLHPVAFGKNSSCCLLTLSTHENLRPTGHSTIYPARGSGWAPFGLSQHEPSALHTGIFHPAAGFLLLIRPLLTSALRWGCLSASSSRIRDNRADLPG